VKRHATWVFLCGCLLFSGHPLLALRASNQVPPSMHPAVKLLDAQGESVLRSGRAVSTMRTCGNCHDTEFIAAHCYHASVGSDGLVAPGQAASGRPWDIGSGLFGRWDALSYGPSQPNLDVKQWLIWAGGRHVGGGPVRSLGVELNCFLCHLPSPDQTARLQELRAGRYEWAATATLASTGIVRKTANGWKWNPTAFTTEGELTDSFPRPRPSSSANCGLCHGLVHQGASPLVFPREAPDWGLETKGQIFSPQRLKDSGLNLANKEALSRPFDVHAERLLQCSSCHNTLNNPAYFSGVARNPLLHLRFEPRRLSPGEYLSQPIHHLAKGHTPQGNVARYLDGTMRRCEHCHDATFGHDWLPYLQRHLAALNCESCHVSYVYAPARQQTDWTVLRPDGTAVVAWRGVRGEPHQASSLLTGFHPLLLPRQELNGTRKLTPHNLVTIWYWVAGDPPTPIDLALLKKALYQGDYLHPQIKSTFDTNGDGVVEATELRLDRPDKMAAVRSRLEALGLRNPHIRGEIQPYSLHHGVAAGEWAVRQCADCHGRESRLTRAMALADYLPGGVMPELIGDANVDWNGRLFVDPSGRLMYQAAPAASGLYVLGQDRWRVGDFLGLLIGLAVVLAVLVHGGWRIHVARKVR
jgi:hypothetical protein